MSKGSTKIVTIPEAEEVLSKFLAKLDPPEPNDKKN